jgi:putative endonuclease
MFHVYILYSPSLQKYYIGSTQHLNIRLEEHNRGKSPFTKSGMPWNLIHAMECTDRSQAIQLEMKIKKRGIKRFLLDLNSML